MLLVLHLMLPLQLLLLLEPQLLLLPQLMLLLLLLKLFLSTIHGSEYFHLLFPPPYSTFLLPLLSSSTAAHLAGRAERARRAHSCIVVSVNIKSFPNQNFQVSFPLMSITSGPARVTKGGCGNNIKSRQEKVTFWQS